MNYGRIRDLVFPLAIISSVLVILVPLPPALLDLMLAANITVSVIVLLTTIYVKTPLDFNVFPSLLLATTLARLVLNVATTRLILTQSTPDSMSAAGQVIQAFGEFVAGDQIIVGIIMFVIIVVIQFVVITKGSTRISEVAARFALDGMPGRQMAIDADLNAGSIDEGEAKRRREEVTAQADFYGAMDGASKFVRGDAIAGIIITLINVAGGFVIGMTMGMDWSQALEVFTKLTIGDGLVSQIPAFLISLAAGLLVTRSTKRVDMSAEFLRQLFARPQALLVAAGFLGVLVFTNLPTIPLVSIGGCCVGLAFMLDRQTKAEAKAATEMEKKNREAEKPKKEERVEDFLAVDPMELELGVELVKLADPNRGGDLLPRITAVRQSVAAEIGIVLPKIRIRDNMQLGENDYRIKIMNNMVGEGMVLPDHWLAMDPGTAVRKVPGLEVRDPAFEQPAVWVEGGSRDAASLYGYTVLEPSVVLTTHLQEIVRRHAEDILTRDATRLLIDELKKTSPTVVDELIPGVMKLSEVQAVLQLLLREEVSIRQLGLILETLGDHAHRIKDPIYLTEHVRHRLARTICSRLRDEQGRLHVIAVDPALEDRISTGIEHNERGLFIRMAPAAAKQICDLIRDETQKLVRQGYPPIVLVNPEIRAGLKMLTFPQLPRLHVLSFNEVSRDTQTESHGLVTEQKPK
ncbi:MAG: flagellar biosynthesis protein FlhA [Planctomycetales bacterium]|nr:flagellar biosynthesis protein FlhA [Planctomycetales bacterium]